MPGFDMISPCTFLKEIFATILTNVFFLKFPYNIHIWHFSMRVLCSAHPPATCLHYPIGKVETYQSESLLGQIFLRSGIWISCVKFHKNRKIDKQHHRGCRLTCARGVTLFCSEIKVKVGAKTDLDTDNEPSVSRFFPNIAFWGQQPTSHILIFSTTCPLCPVIRQCVSHLTLDMLMLMLMHSHSLNFSNTWIPSYLVTCRDPKY